MNVQSVELTRRERSHPQLRGAAGKTILRRKIRSKLHS